MSDDQRRRLPDFPDEDYDPRRMREFALALEQRLEAISIHNDEMAQAVESLRAIPSRAAEEIEGGDDVATLEELNDVVFSGLSEGDLLRYTGTVWTNSGLDVSDIPALPASKITSGQFADARISQSSVTQHVGAINHEDTLGYVADEHVAHSGVTLTAGEGLSGGGTIAASRTFDVDINGLSAQGTPTFAADYVMIYDAGLGALRKVLLDDLPGGGGGATIPNGGITGQIIRKQSGTDGDVDWEDNFRLIDNTMVLETGSAEWDLTWASAAGPDESLDIGWPDDTSALLFEDNAGTKVVTVDGDALFRHGAANDGLDVDLSLYNMKLDARGQSVGATFRSVSDTSADIRTAFAAARNDGTDMFHIRIGSDANDNDISMRVYSGGSTWKNLITADNVTAAINFQNRPNQNSADNTTTYEIPRMIRSATEPAAALCEDGDIWLKPVS